MKMQAAGGRQRLAVRSMRDCAGPPVYEREGANQQPITGVGVCAERFGQPPCLPTEARRCRAAAANTNAKSEGDMTRNEAVIRSSEMPECPFGGASTASPLVESSETVTGSGSARHWKPCLRVRKQEDSASRASMKRIAGGRNGCQPRGKMEGDDGVDGHAMPHRTEILGRNRISTEPGASPMRRAAGVETGSSPCLPIGGRR